MSDSSNSQSFMERYLTPIAVLLGAIIIAFAFIFGRGAVPANTADQNAGEQMAVDIKNVKVEGSPFIGSPTAPVTIAVWYDFQCAYCKRFEQTTLVDIKRDYVDTGKVKIVFKDFQFFPGSEEVAVFGRAMWEAYPEHYGAWQASVMNIEAGESGLTVAAVKALAAAIPGVDAERVSALATEKKDAYQKAVQADREEGSSFGIKGTPSSIVGTTFIDGARPTDFVKPLIDAELAK